MKLDDVKKVNEMAKPKQICSKCGHAMANFHTYRGKKPDGSPDWRCKSNIAPAPGYGGTPAAAPGAAPAAQAAAPVQKSAPASASPAASAAATPAAAPASGSSALHAQITKWLTSYNVTGFHINDDDTVDCDEDVTFRGLDRTSFPSKLQFNKVGGDFVVNTSGFTTLRGCPREVGTSEFGGNFLCAHNDITNLEGGPEKVSGYYSASGCDQLESIKGIARYIGGSVLVSNCPKLKSLEGVQDMIDHIGNQFDAGGTPLESHVVGLMLIDGLESVVLQNKDVEKIINKHLKEGRNPYDCQEELIDGGFEAFAQL